MVDDPSLISPALVFVCTKNREKIPNLNTQRTTAWLDEQSGIHPSTLAGAFYTKLVS
jgi:hypothetical protein